MAVEQEVAESLVDFLGLPVGQFLDRPDDLASVSVIGHWLLWISCVYRCCFYGTVSAVLAAHWWISWRHSCSLVV